MRSRRQYNTRNNVHFGRDTDSMPNIHTDDHDINDVRFEFNPHGRSGGDFNHIPDFADLLPNNVREDNAHGWGNILDGFCKITFYIGNMILVGFLAIFSYTILIDQYPNLSIYDIIPSYSHIMQRMSQSQTNLQQSEMQNIEHRLNALQQEFQALTKQIDTAIKYRNEIEQSFETKQIAEIDDKIQEAIRTYDADKVAMIDYALEYSGATVVSTPDTEPYPAQVAYSLLGGLLNMRPASSPRVILQPGTMPGQCFAFHGRRGRIRVRLSARVIIKAVTMDHASPTLLDDVGSAPKEFKVFGLPSGDSDTMHELGHFTFTLTGKPQTFSITRPSLASPAPSVHQSHQQSLQAGGVYQYVELQVLSNYGRAEYTCVYRFRIHGDPA